MPDVPSPSAYGTRAFHAAYAKRLGTFEVVSIRLRHGAADVPAFERALAAPSGEAGSLFLVRERDHAEQVQGSIHLQAIALWLFAAAMAGAGVLVAGQLLARQISIESDDHATLRALGMHRGQLWLLGMARAAVVGVGAVIVAVGTATALSPLTPIGLARIAEPDPGITVPGATLAAGAAILLGAVLLVAALPALRASRAPERASGAGEGRIAPSAAARALAAAGAPPTIVAGFRLALEPGRGRSAVPVRSSLASVALALAAAAGGLTFTSSLDHLNATPRLYGWGSGDAGAYDGERDVRGLVETLEADPRIASVTYGQGGIPIVVNGIPLTSMSMTGDAGPTLIEGRKPHGTDAEILLGSSTLQSAGARIGSMVDVHLQGLEEPVVQLMVVGRAVFPPLGPRTSLGKGALLPFEVLAELGRASFGGDGLVSAQELTVSFAAGVDQDATIADLRRSVHPDFQRLSTPQPDDLVNFGRVKNMPLVLAGAMALVASMTLAHVLVTSIVRRRRDLAVLKTLGFVRGQVRRAVASQASGLAAASLILGVPLGVVAGRWTWAAFAGRLGTISEPAVPLGALWLSIAAALVVGNAIAAVPARTAARTPPAIVLRTE